jgi:hypothetical protein
MIQNLILRKIFNEIILKLLYLKVLTVDEIQFFTIPASVVFVYIGHKLSLYKRELTMYLFL